MALKTGEYQDEQQTATAIDKFTAKQQPLATTGRTLPDQYDPSTALKSGASPYTPEQTAQMRTAGIEQSKQDWAALSPEEQQKYYDAGGAPEWATGGLMDQSPTGSGKPLPPPDGSHGRPIPSQEDEEQDPNRARADDYYDEAAGVGPQDGYDIEAPNAEVTNREAGQEEMAGYQLDQLLGRDSELSRRAMQEGKDFAASRGLMNSSIAGGNAYGAWVDRATPIAMDQAGTYQRTAAENMAATNAGGLQDANNQTQANLAQAGYDAKRDSELRGNKLGAADDERKAAIGIENREDTQEYNSDERAAIEAFQRGERIDTQDFTDEQRQAVERWQTDERLAGEGYNTSEREAIEAWNRGERIDTQDFTDEQRKAVELWQSSERLATQGYNTSERKAINAFQKGERIDTQDFTDEQRKAVEHWQTGERVANEGYNTSEREAIEAFQKGERLDTQDFTDQQREAADYFQWNLAKLDEKVKMAGIAADERAAYTQAWSMIEMGKYQSIGSAGAAIYGNTELTAAQQQTAVANMIAFFNGIAPSMGPAPGSGSTTPGDTNEPPPNNTPPPNEQNPYMPDPTDPKLPGDPSLPPNPTNPNLPPVLPQNYDLDGLMR